MSSSSLRTRIEAEGVGLRAGQEAGLGGLVWEVCEEQEERQKQRQKGTDLVGCRGPELTIIRLPSSFSLRTHRLRRSLLNHPRQPQHICSPHRINLTIPHLPCTRSPLILLLSLHPTRSLRRLFFPPPCTPSTTLPFIFPLSPISGYGILKWAIADNAIRNSKVGHIQGKFA